MDILFSPVGSTDPVRGCRDGGCLHILRHYHPDCIILYYTAEMEKRQRETQMYTRGVHHVQEDCLIEEIFSGITEAHLYDEYLTNLPQAVLTAHEKYPDARMILNLSSGTPQIKVILAIMATEYEWCLGVQVASPEKRSNVNNNPVRDIEDVEELLTCNEDDEEGAENRCSEPPLEVLRFYRERYQIMSLLHQYEYNGAWTLVKGNTCASKTVKELIHFSMYRSNLQINDAKHIMRKFQGVNIFPFDKEGEILIEYLLIMQMNKKKGQYSGFMVQITPFLYEFFKVYLKKNIKTPILPYCRIERGNQVLKCELLCRDSQGLALLAFLNRAFGGKYRDSEFSFILLWHIFHFVLQQGGAKDPAMHIQLMKNKIMNPENKYIDAIRRLRNGTAHEIIDVTENTIIQKTGLRSDDILQSFWDMLLLVYGSSVKKQQNSYDWMNDWIEKLLMPIEAVK